MKPGGPAFPGPSLETAKQGGSMKDKILIVSGFAKDEKARQAQVRAVRQAIEAALEAMERADEAARKASEERKGDE